jgi:hypothetical protein
MTSVQQTDIDHESIEVENGTLSQTSDDEASPLASLQSPPSLTAKGTSSRRRGSFRTFGAVVSEAVNSPQISPTMQLLRRLLSRETDKSAGVPEDCLDQSKNGLRLELEYLMERPDFRNTLVCRLLSDHKSELARKVRLLSGVGEVLRTSEKAGRSFKASKVVETFIKPNSRYLVGGIPAEIIAELSQLKMRAFEAVSLLLTRDLLDDSSVQSTITEYQQLL